MTVQCPRCQTQYRVPEARLAGAQPVFKCTRCDLVFKTEAESRPPKRKRKTDSNLSFDFPKESADDPQPPDDPTAGEEADGQEDEPAFVSRLEAGKKTKAAATAPPPPEEEEDEEDPEDEFEIEDEDEEPIEEDEEDAPPVIVAPKKKPASIRPRAKKTAPRRSPLKPISVCVGLIIVFYALAAIALVRDPAIALQQLSDLPVVGNLLGRDHLLVWRLEVTDLEGGLNYIRDHKLAYVVSGRAVNTTSQDLRIVEVEGGLVVDGKPTRKQRVYAANQARSTIRDLSASEVEMLLRLEPNRRFRIRPGESASFLLVFPDPPAGFDEVIVRIVDARAT